MQERTKIKRKSLKIRRSLLV